MKNFRDYICPNCKKILKGTEFVEEELDKKTYRFCSKDCADKFELNKQ